MQLKFSYNHINKYFFQNLTFKNSVLDQIKVVINEILNDENFIQITNRIILISKLIARDSYQKLQILIKKREVQEKEGKEEGKKEERKSKRKVSDKNFNRQTDFIIIRRNITLLLSLHLKQISIQSNEILKLLSGGPGECVTYCKCESFETIAI